MTNEQRLQRQGLCNVLEDMLRTYDSIGDSVDNPCFMDVLTGEYYPCKYPFEGKEKLKCRQCLQEWLAREAETINDR